MLLIDILDLFNLGQFDPTNQMIPLTVIPLSGTHCSNLRVVSWLKFSLAIMVEVQPVENWMPAEKRLLT